MNTAGRHRCAMTGLAVGDALGKTLELSPRGLDAIGAPHVDEREALRFADCEYQNSRIYTCL